MNATPRENKIETSVPLPAAGEPSPARLHAREAAAGVAHQNRRTDELVTRWKPSPGQAAVSVAGNGRRVFAASYLATPAAVGIARNAAKLATLGWGFSGEKADDVCLVVSELVTNSVNVAPHGEIRVTVAEDVPGHVTIEVWDESEELPQRKPAGSTDPGGRGLWIVEVLAVHCGFRQENGGKVVYAVL